MSEVSKDVEVESRPEWRLITINGSIEYETAEQFNLDMVKKGPETPVAIHVRSPGGHGLSASTIKDIIESHHCKKVIVGMSIVASAAWDIFAVTPSLRLCYRTTLFMQHQSSYNINGCSRDEANMTIGVQNHLTETQDNDLMKGFGIDHKTLQKLIAKESWISSSEALFFGERGVVDGIIAKELRYEDFIVLTREGYKRIDLNDIYTTGLLKTHPLMTEDECLKYGLVQHVPVPVGLKFPKAFA